MSLYKQPGSDVWYANISVPGQPRLRRSTGCTDRTEAQKVHDQMKADLWRVDPVLRGRTWGSAVNKWLAVQERTESELLSLRKFSAKFPDRALTDVTPEAVDKALSFCKTAGTYMRYRAMIAAILNLSDHKIKLMSRREKPKAREWLTKEQWAKLYAELPAHLKAPALFAVLTGLRRENVFGLTWDRVDLERQMVWVEAEDTKSRKAIGIPLSIDAANVLKSQTDRSQKFVFTYRKKAVRNPRKAFTESCVRAGIGSMVEGTYHGPTWHCLRHTWATWHIQSGTPLDVLKTLGGWSDLRMVMHYAHHAPNYLASYAGNIKL